MLCSIDSRIRIWNNENNLHLVYFYHELDAKTWDNEIFNPFFHLKFKHVDDESDVCY